MSQSHLEGRDEPSARILSDSSQDDFLQLFVQTYPEPTFAIDAEGYIQLWNEKMVDFAGYTAEEVVGRQAYDVFQTDGESKTLAEEIVELETAVREDQIRTAQGKDGGTVHTRAKGFPLYGENGSVVGAVEVLGLVTELVEAREQVQSLQQELSTKVEAGIIELETAAEEIADSATEMSTDIDEQVESVNEVSGEVSTFSATVEEIASSAEEVSSQSQQARETAEQSAEKGSEVQDRMGNVENTVDALADETADMEARLDEIDQIVEVINNIADQTNLLALNANIEAARADQSGDGFAVVANEIKDLAEQSKQEVDQIETIIEEIQGNARGMIAKVDETNEEFTVVTENLDELITAQKEIVEAIGETSNGIKEIADATDEQAASSEEIASMVDDTVNALEGVADEVDAVAAATEEQTQQVGKISEKVAQVESKIDSLDH